MTDDFNRANGPLGSNWAAVNIIGYTGTLAIASDQVEETVAGQHAISCWASNTFDNDQYAECSIPVNAAYAGPAVRCNARDGNAYALYVSDTSGLVFLWNNGNPSQIGSVTFPTAPGPTDVVRLEVAGSTLTAKLNGTPVGTVTDTFLTSGAPGLALYDVTARLGNFTGGPVSGGPPAPPASPGLYIGQYSKVILNNATALQIERTQPWSMLASVNMGINPFVPSNGGLIFTNVENAPYTGWEVWLAPKDAEGNCIVRVKIMHSNNDNLLIQVSGTTVVSDDQWHLIGVSYDGSSTAAGVKIYIDGVQDSVNIDWDTLSATIVTGAGAMWIGGQYNGGTFGLNGVINFLGIVDVAQNGAYFAAHASRATVPAVDASNMLYYAFQEEAGTTLNDQSSNGYNATISGTGYAWY